MGKKHSALAATGKRARSLEYEPIAPKKQRCYKSEPPMHSGEKYLGPVSLPPEDYFSDPNSDEAERSANSREESLISIWSSSESNHTASDTGDDDEQSEDPLASPSPSAESNHAITDQEIPPFTAQFFNDMASTITKCFPAENFAIQHHCEYEDVCQAINGVVVGLLTIDGFMDFEMESRETLPVAEYGKTMIDRWNEIPKKPGKRYPVSRPRAPAGTVKRVKVFRDEYGNYVPLDEMSEEQELIEEDIRLRQKRRQRRQRGDLQALLSED